MSPATLSQPRYVFWLVKTGCGAQQGVGRAGLDDPPLRSLHERGFRVPGNSDSTGSQPEAANPFHSIWCALTRCTRLRDRAGD